MKDPNEVLKLGYICQWWRQVALACPWIWSHIDICRPRLAKEFLARMDTSTPISLMASPGLRLSLFYHSERFLHLVNRVRRLDLTLLPADMRLFLSHVGLHLRMIVDLRLGQARDFSENLHFIYDLPHLRRLSLEGVTIKWDSPKLNLTELSLCNISGSRAPAVVELEDIISHSPELETIILDHVAFKSESEVQTRVIELHHLRSLRLSMPPRFTWRILASLLLPSSARITVRIWDDNERIDCVFTKYGGSLHPLARYTNFTALSIRPRSIIFKRDSSEARPFSDDNRSLVIETPQSICVPIFATLSNVFDIYRLTTLELDFMHPAFLRLENADASTLATRKFLESTVNLLTLRICQALAAMVMPVLGRPSVGGVVCPHLATLSFGTPSQMWWGFPPAKLDGHASEGWLTPVLAGLQARDRWSRTKLDRVEFIGVGHISWTAAILLYPYVEVLINSVCSMEPKCRRCLEDIGSGEIPSMDSGLWQNNI